MVSGSGRDGRRTHPVEQRGQSHLPGHGSLQLRPTVPCRRQSDEPFITDQPCDGRDAAAEPLLAACALEHLVDAAPQVRQRRPFAVEQQPDGSYAIRYALAALKNVGLQAMRDLETMINMPIHCWSRPAHAMKSAIHIGCARMWIRPRRSRVFTVPSGRYRRSAISLWL